ncbi:MAG: PEP-CTERM sorting domain-containing protein, partial [Verrucomicrobiota bacterium]
IPGNAVAVATSSLDDTIDSTSFTNSGAMLYPAQPILYVTKDIGFGVVDGGFITISQVEQSFEQVTVPEPTTLALAGLSGLSVLLFRRQRK